MSTKSTKTKTTTRKKTKPKGAKVSSKKTVGQLADDTNTKIGSESKALKSIEQGFGFLVTWKKDGFTFMSPTLLTAEAGKIPMQDFVNFEPHTVRQAIKLACSDRSFTKVKENGAKVEARLVHEDEEQGLYTIEFLSYQKKSEKEGERNQTDRVVLDMNGSQLDSGTSELATTWLTAFQKHLNNWNGNDIYLHVINPYLKAMKAFPVSTSNYYVANNSRNQTLLSELRTFLESIQYKLFVLTQAKDSQTQEALSDQFNSILSERLQSVQNKVDEWRYKSRVHGKSEEAVLSELGSILTDAMELESSLETELKDLKSQLSTVRQEADLILNSQSPSGINPAIFEKIKQMVQTESMDIGDGQKTWIFAMQDSLQGFVVGSKLRADVDKALHHLGFYGFINNGYICVKELKTLDSIDI